MMQNEMVDLYEGVDIEDYMLNLELYFEKLEEP